MALCVIVCVASRADFPQAHANVGGPARAAHAGAWPRPPPPPDRALSPLASAWTAAEQTFSAREASFLPPAQAGRRLPAILLLRCCCCRFGDSLFVGQAHSLAWAGAPAGLLHHCQTWQWSHTGRLSLNLVLCARKSADVASPKEKPRPDESEAQVRHCPRKQAWDKHKGR